MYTGRSGENAEFSISTKRELSVTWLLPNFQVYRHTELMPVVTYVSCARPPAPLRARYTNRLDPEDNRGIRNVPLRL